MEVSFGVTGTFAAAWAYVLGVGFDNVVGLGFIGIDLPNFPDKLAASEFNGLSEAELGGIAGV